MRVLRESFAAAGLLIAGLTMAPDASHAQKSNNPMSHDINAICLAILTNRIDSNQQKALGQYAIEHSDLKSQKNKKDDFLKIVRKGRQMSSFKDKFKDLDPENFGLHILEGMCATTGAFKKGTNETLFDSDKDCYDTVIADFPTGERVGKVIGQYKVNGDFVLDLANEARKLGKDITKPAQTGLEPFKENGQSSFKALGRHLIEGLCAY
ncbi:MAG: hypothetical protein SFW09_04780 [Hyphomicrobiaceae bacterium]|nr:hypothetical protein [Hyphomicrobiaceae bacterium]